MKGRSSFQIESVDRQGRPSFRQIVDFNCLEELRDDEFKSKSFCSFKRKSDLSNPEQLLTGRSRITIKAFNNEIISSLSGVFSQQNN